MQTRSANKPSWLGESCCDCSRPAQYECEGCGTPLCPDCYDQGGGFCTACWDEDDKWGDHLDE